jgi:DNA-binding NtrC family response regulator
MTAKILVIDDEKLIRWTMNDVLQREGYHVITAECGETGLQLVEGERPDLILLDLRLPGMDGMEVLERAKQIAPNAVVIIVTAHGTPESAVQAMKLGAHDYLHKPFDLEETRAAVRKALGTVWTKKDGGNSAPSPEGSA